MLLEREELRGRVIGLVGHGHLAVTTKAFDEAASRVSRQLLMQAEYRRFVVFTSGDDHEEQDEWIAGLTYFF